jgi:cobalt-zinc-cadmium efflux system protein
MPNNHHHSHGVEDISDSVLLWAVIINLGLSVFEFGAGVISGSLALMADALHNTNDAAALLIAYIARKISRKGADHHFTFGYRRAELIGAMIQLTALVLVALYLIYESSMRLFEPQPLLGGWIMAASGVALVVDVITVWLLWAMSKGSLNVRAAFLHNLTDAGASVAVLIGGVAVTWLDWTWVDPLISFAIAGYILSMSVGLLRRTSTILMEGSPPDFPFEDLLEVLVSIDGVVEMHHLHVWELDEQHRALEAHVVIENLPTAAHSTLRKKIKDLLHDKFHIGHSTLEFELVNDDCFYQCDGNGLPITKDD